MDTPATIGAGLEDAGVPPEARERHQDLAEQVAQVRHHAGQQGRGLEALVSSYAWWEDMVKFMDKPDEKWASTNVDNIVGIPTGGDAVWVLDPALKLVHTIDKDYTRPALPFADTEALRRVIDEWTRECLAIEARVVEGSQSALREREQLEKDKAELIRQGHRLILALRVIKVVDRMNGRGR